MVTYKYSKWDGSQGLIDLDENELMHELERRLMSQGNLSQALWKMQREGIGDGEGRRLSGNKDLVQRLHQLRQSQPGGSRLLDKMDRLEVQLEESQRSRSMDSIDRELVRELFGDEAAEELEVVCSSTKALETAGYITGEGGQIKLTPRGKRKIGQKALEDIFDRLKRDRAGNHSLRLSGISTERTDETRKYQYGDAFELHLEKTIMNSLYRKQSLPLDLKVDDFEVFKTTQLVRTATVIVLDLSFSMSRRNSFQSAKQVALALDELIHSKYPKDVLHIVGIASYACEIKRKDLPYIEWDEFEPYTNMQQGLALAGRLLAKESATNKQVILISDGEPTAHTEDDGKLFFRYPPGPRTIRKTLESVKDLTRKGIVINAFIMKSEDCPDTFVRQMAQVNKGRVFFTSPANLGQYLVLDYVSGKSRRV